MARSLAAKIEAANTALMGNGNLDAIGSLSGLAMLRSQWRMPRS
jgi:hypothetical protein